MSSDEYCDVDNVIEYVSADEDGEKSSSQVKRKRAQKTTPIQFEKMMDFMKLIDKKSLGKIQFNELWETLICELNDLGPPLRTSDQWKKIWFDYKSKNLKKPKVSSMETLTSAEATHDEADSPIQQQTASSSSTAVVQTYKSTRRLNKETMEVVDIVELVPSHRQTPKEHQSRLPKNNDVMQKLNVIIEETKKVNENITVMIATGTKTNEILEKLLMK